MNIYSLICSSNLKLSQKYNKVILMDCFSFLFVLIHFMNLIHLGFKVCDCNYMIKKAFFLCLLIIYIVNIYKYIIFILELCIWNLKFEIFLTKKATLFFWIFGSRTLFYWKQHKKLFNSYYLLLLILLICCLIILDFLI